MQDVFKLSLLLTCSSLLLLGMFAAAAAFASLIGLALLLFPANKERQRNKIQPWQGGHKTDEHNGI